MKQRIINQLKTCSGFELGSWVVIFLVLVSTPPFAIFITGSLPMNRVRILLGGLGTVIIAALFLWRNHRFLAAACLLPASYVIITRWPLATALLAIAGHEYSLGIFVVDLVAMWGVYEIGRKRGWGVAWAFPLIVCMIHMIGGAMVFFYMAIPPTDNYCAQIDEQKGARWMTRGTTLYSGADMVVLDDGKKLAFTSKSWHDSFLGKHFMSQAHGVAILTNEDPPQGEKWDYKFVDVPWHFLPEFLVLDSKGRLALTFVEWHGDHHFGVINEPLSDSPNLDHFIKVPQTPGPLAPNGLIEYNGKYIVFGHDAEDDWPLKAHDSGDMLWVDMETFEPGLRWPAPPFRGDPNPCWFSFDKTERCGDGGPILRLDYIHNGDGHLLMSTLGGLILDFDLNEQKATRFKDSGTLSAVALNQDPIFNYVATSDMLQHRIDIYDRATTTKIGGIDLPYSPRALHWWPGKNILFVGGFFTGEIHAYRFVRDAPDDEQHQDFSQPDKAAPEARRLHFLHEISPPVFAGGMFRKLHYDDASGMLYGLTKCGLVRIDPEVAFNLRDKNKIPEDKSPSLPDADHP